MRPTTPREGPQLSASWIVLDQEGEEVALRQPHPRRSPRDAHAFDDNEEEDEVLGVLSLHPDEVVASGGGNTASMWGSMFRMLDRGAMATPAAMTAEEEEEKKEEKEDERAIGALQDQRGEQQQEGEVPSAQGGSVPAPAEAPRQEEGEEKKEGEGEEDGRWWRRVTSLLMTHFRAILKTLSDPASSSSCCSSRSNYSLQDELRLACPYLRRQPRQRVLLITVVVPVAVVVGVTAAVVLVGVCASSSSSSSSSSPPASSSSSTKRGDRSCLATSPSSSSSSSSSSASSTAGKAPLLRVL